MNFELTIYACVIAGITGYVLPGKFNLKSSFLFDITLSLSVIVSCIRIARIIFIPPSQDVVYKFISNAIMYTGAAWFFLSVLNILMFKRQSRSFCMPASKIFQSYLKMVSSGYQSASIFNCALFIFYTIGKAKHWQEMEMFFTSSGLPVFFTFFTVVLECTMAFILLLPLSAIIHIYSALILLFEMLGAIAVHLFNKDPIVASFDALNQIVVIGILLFWNLQKIHFSKKE